MSVYACMHMIVPMWGFECASLCIHIICMRAVPDYVEAERTHAWPLHRAPPPPGQETHRPALHAHMHKDYSCEAPCTHNTQALHMQWCRIPFSVFPRTLAMTNSSRLTSSPRVMRLVWMPKMRRLVLASGSGNSILRSMRPAMEKRKLLPFAFCH